METQQIGRLLVYAYPVIWAAAAMGFVVMVGAYLQTRRPHTVSAAMWILCLGAYFVVVGVSAFQFPYQIETLETRFATGAVAVSTIVHFFVAAWEEWATRRRADKRNGNGKLNGG
jgi:hypothetical membrane protein